MFVMLKQLRRHARSLRHYCGLLILGVLPLTMSCGDSPLPPADSEIPSLVLRSPRLALLNAQTDFDATGSTDNFGIVRYEAEFGDGTAVQLFTSVNFSHRYAQPGTFTLRLQAFDDAGQLSTIRRHVTVVQNLTPPYCAEDAGLTCAAQAVCKEGMCYDVGPFSETE